MATVHENDLTIDRAQQIVAYAENEFAKGDLIEDTFVPFARGGACTRREALDALYIVIADYYRMASHSGHNSDEAMREFLTYARLSGSISIRLSCVTITDPASGMKVAVAENVETVESFVNYLKTLNPEAPEFWSSVYGRIKRKFLDPPDVQPSVASPPEELKPWWRLW